MSTSKHGHDPAFDDLIADGGLPEAQGDRQMDRRRANLMARLDAALDCSRPPYPAAMHDIWKFLLPELRDELDQAIAGSLVAKDTEERLRQHLARAERERDELLAAAKVIASFAVAWQPLTPGDIRVLTDAIAKAECR
jgi:hypothetical protein